MMLVSLLGALVANAYKSSTSLSTRLYMVLSGLLRVDLKIVGCTPIGKLKNGANVSLEEYQYATTSTYSPTMSELPQSGELDIYDPQNYHTKAN